VGAVSDGAPALCLLAPDCLVPVAELPDAIRKAGKAGYLRGGLVRAASTRFFLTPGSRRLLVTDLSAELARACVAV
jgi:hypothetical protein